MKQRVNVYIDGFNFYYGLKSNRWRKFYWLDLVKFFSMFIRPNQELNNLYYFTAVPTDPEKSDRQDLFLSANRLNPKFNMVLGKFLKKSVYRGGNQFFSYEEKQTDVNIAVEMIRNVFLDRCDVSILVSADSDLLPAIRLIREISPLHKIFVYFPPNRYSADLDQNSNATINLVRYEHRFKSSLLPDQIPLPNNYILIRPEKWK
jgi:uncharacterized LabA/DUF88 family protein